MGARIVISSFGSFGDVYPYVGLALGLAARGHRPILAMPGWYRQTVEREGLDFHPVRPDVDPSDRSLVARIMDARRGTEFIVKDLILPALRDSQADLEDAAKDADLIITHPITFAGPIVAQRRNLPWASTVLAPMSFFSKYDLPVFPPLPAAKKLERIPGMSGALVALAKAATRRWSKPVYDLRNELGLDRGDDPIFEGQHSPELVLAVFSRVLGAPQPDWPPNVRITGAIPYNGPGEHGLSDELEEFLSAGEPPVVFTLGSSAVAAAGNFYGESVEAVRRLNMRAVLLTGSHPENVPTNALPDGVLLVASAPHAALFPRASAIVHQGGAGTLHHGLRSGRPTLVVPFAHDQPDNAWRVARLGVSRTLQPRRYTADRVVRELQELLQDGEYLRRASVVAEQVRAEDGVRAACDAIEAFLEPDPLPRSTVSGNLPLPFRPTMQ